MEPTTFPDNWELAPTSNTLNDLATTIPNVGMLTTGSVATARKLLYFLSTDHRFTLDQEAELSLLISAKPAMGAILVTYHIDGLNQLTYLKWKHWAHLGLQCISYIMQKTIASLKIIEVCPPYLLQVSKLTGLQNQMMLGEKSKHDLQAFGTIVVQLQTKALADFC